MIFRLTDSYADPQKLCCLLYSLNFGHVFFLTFLWACQHWNLWIHFTLNVCLFIGTEDCNPSTLVWESRSFSYQEMQPVSGKTSSFPDRWMLECWHLSWHYRQNKSTLTTLHILYERDDKGKGVRENCSTLPSPGKKLLLCNFALNCINQHTRNSKKQIEKHSDKQGILFLALQRFITIRVLWLWQI